ncbi:hypothetical protein [Paenirhodobacter populi]|uniref:Uncharacterized protein n=1 Tax=Paenirhodobacter populi TaxID=2306993 RepID=A0A443IQ98_9RHOB|nr:hypothetical protein [Sinirhodobacter populi]RWR08473.1 hypothetical protein D2T33_15365 [Sinirhodobacter populi]
MMAKTGQGAAVSKKARRKNRRNGTKNVHRPAELKSPWDYGADGLANRAGLARERVADIDGTGTIKRARRVDMLEQWHKRGLLSVAAYGVAEKLRNAYEVTQRMPATDYQRPTVDSSPKPDHAIAIQTDRISRYHAISQHISANDWPLVERMVLDGAGPEPLGYRGPVAVKQALARLDLVLSGISDAI